jgi:hypothetical protein
MTIVRLPNMALRREAMLLAFALAVVCTLLVRDREVDAANANCGVYCTGLSCYIGLDGNLYQVLNGQLCNQWYNATAGCGPNQCVAAGNVNLQFQKAALKTNICPALPQLNVYGQQVCQNPVGPNIPSSCYSGCTPNASTSAIQN